MRGTWGRSHDLAPTQRWQRVQRRMALEDRALQLSLGQGHQVEREEAQPEREGSCRHAKAAFGFNTCQQRSVLGLGGVWVGHCLLTGSKPHFWGPREKVPKRPDLTGDTPKPSTRNRGLFTAPQPIFPRAPHPSPTCPHSRLSSLHPGSQAVPRRPLLRAGEVLSQALYSYLCRAVINSQRLAAATRGGRFCPPATLQRQGLICLKHTPQPFHGDPFQFHGARTVLTGNEKERLIYGSAFQSLPSSLSTHTEGGREFPSPKDPHWGQGLNRQGRGTAVRRGCWKENPALPVLMSWSPPALSSPVSSSVAHH